LRHLDTNIVIALLRGDQQVASRLEAALPDIGVSTLVVAELLYGAQASARPAEGLLAVRTLLATVQVIDFDLAAAEVYGRVRLELRRKGYPTGEIDLLIASVALAHGATLVTNNRRDFEHIDNLVLEDWLA
jgi:tRNA(fMet)-specific endonuclease VapC